MLDPHVGILGAHWADYMWDPYVEGCMEGRTHQQTSLD